MKRRSFLTSLGTVLLSFTRTASAERVFRYTPSRKDVRSIFHFIRVAGSHPERSTPSSIAQAVHDAVYSERWESVPYRDEVDDPDADVYNMSIRFLANGSRPWIISGDPDEVKLNLWMGAIESSDDYLFGSIEDTLDLWISHGAKLRDLSHIEVQFYCQR